MSGEIELLVKVVRPEPDLGAVADVIGGVEDWGEMLEMAAAHRLSALFYWRLKEAGLLEALPEWAANELEAGFHASAQISLVLAGELRQLLIRFEEAGMSAVPFKGPAMAQFIYGTPALRPSGDLDIVIHRKDLDRLEALLAAAGFERQEQPQRERWGERYHEQFLRPGQTPLTFRQPLSVELHWAFARRYWSIPLSLADFESHLEPVSLAGKDIPHFAASDLLFLLCLHGGRHNWSRLIWLADVAHLVAGNPALDWGRVEEVAAVGGRRILLLGLCLSQRLFGVALPEEIDRSIGRDGRVLALASETEKRLLAGEIKRETDYWYGLQLRERWPDRLRYLRFYLPKLLRWNEKDRAFVRLPGQLSFMYYGVRPLRLIWERVGKKGNNEAV